MITSPGESSGSNCSIRLSTAGPALTISITLRGVASCWTSSSTEWQPTKFLPFARPCDQVVDDAGRAIEDRDAIAPALDIEGQVLAHHRQTDQSDVAKLGHGGPGGPTTQGGQGTREARGGENQGRLSDELRQGQAPDIDAFTREDRTSPTNCARCGRRSWWRTASRLPPLALIPRVPLERQRRRGGGRTLLWPPPKQPLFRATDSIYPGGLAISNCWRNWGAAGWAWSTWRARSASSESWRSK